MYLKVAFVVLFLFTASSFLYDALHKNEQESKIEALQKQLTDQQNDWTKRIDSIKMIAHQSDSMAAVWRSTARALGARSDSLQQKLSLAKGRIVKVKDEINELPDSALVGRFYKHL